MKNSPFDNLKLKPLNLRFFLKKNNRYARLVSDLFLFSNNHKLPKWPNQELIEETTTRKQYIEALQTADKGNYAPLEEYIKKLLV